MIQKYIIVLIDILGDSIQTGNIVCIKSTHYNVSILVECVCT